MRFSAVFEKSKGILPFPANNLCRNPKTWGFMLKQNVVLRRALSKLEAY